MKSELTTFLSFFRQQDGFNNEAFLNLIEDTNEDVTLQILARFQKTLAESQAALRSGIDNNDRDLLWKTCHKVAGSAELLGFKRFALTSKDLSHSLRASTDIESHLEELETHTKACETLNREIGSHCPNLTNYLG